MSFTTNLLFSVLLAFFLTGSLLAQSDDPPNIIFILTDDQRWDALGYAGNPYAHTPEMDRLAQQGAYFEKAFVTTPICAASRATILSGLYERKHRYNFQTGAIRNEYMDAAYPYVLREAGYHTGFYGKFGVNYEHQDDLFDDYEYYDRGRAKDRRGYYYKTLGKDTVHLTRYTGQQALDFIDGAPKNKPFCLSLSFSAPHAHDAAEKQYFWQQSVAELLANTTIDDPALGEDTYFDRLPEAVREGFNRTRWYWRYDTPEKYQHSVKGYHRMIAGIDAEIGKIRQQLEQNGLADNTVIILMGDNGYFLGERQLAGKWLMYDNSVRVPLIIYDPRQNKHRDIKELVLNVDVPATMVDLAQTNIPEGYQGKSLVPLVANDRATALRDTILLEHLWEFANIPPSEGVRTQDWKYLRYNNDHRLEELYYLPDDPQEINNLVRDPKHAGALDKMRAATQMLTLQFSDDYAQGPSGLLVNLLRKPTAVALPDDKPTYSWIVPRAAGTQNAYQILVAASRETLDQNVGDIWDSGRVAGGQSSNIIHEGPPLSPNQNFFWKVRIWDEGNRLSDYSEAQEFRVGTPDGDIMRMGSVYQVDRIAPVVFRPSGKGAYYVDFGKAAFANMEINYTAPRADTLLIHLGEQLEGSGVNRKPQGHIRYQAVKLPVKKGQHTYQLPIVPDERNTTGQAILLPDSFPVLLPYRYAEFENVQGNLRADDLLQLAYHTYFEEDASAFTSSDTILNQVWDICKYSMKATSFTGYYVDGDRERIPYEADAYLNQLGHYNVDREYLVARRTMAYFMDHPTWPTEWLLHNALMFDADYQYTGNTEMIASHYETLKEKTLMELARADGLISSHSDKVTDAYMQKLGFTKPGERLKDIVDWPPAQKDTGWKLATPEGERDGYEFMPINTVVNCFFFENMRIMATFADILGKYEDAQAFTLMAAKVKQAINQKLLDTKRGVYIDGEGSTHASLHANMLALAFDLVPEQYVKSVTEFIKSRGMAASVYGSQYLLDALYQAGEADYALELMTATHDRSWYNMIKVGSTITLEAWDMKYKPNADWNHAWGAVPANVIPRRMWGILPKTPGFGQFQIRPMLSRLEHSSIKVPTIKGTIEAAYRRINNRNERYEVTVPGNTLGYFMLGNAAGKEVRLNGERVNTLAGFVLLEPGQHTLELRINSF